MWDQNLQISHTSDAWTITRTGSFRSEWISQPIWRVNGSARAN